MLTVVCATSYLSICVCFYFFGITCVFVLERLSYLSSSWSCYSVQSEDTASFLESRKNSRSNENEVKTSQLERLSSWLVSTSFSFDLGFFSTFSRFRRCTKTNHDSKFQFHQDRGPARKLAKIALASSLKKYIVIYGSAIMSGSVVCHSLGGTPVGIRSSFVWLGCGF